MIPVLNQAAKRCALGLLNVYQRWISPCLPPSCRFVPTCSEYARQAVVHHGVLKGSVLAFFRLCKCHPFHPGGHDPVPMSTNAGITQSPEGPRN